MADNTIGKAALVLSTDAEPLLKGLEETQASIDQFFGKAQEAATVAGQAIGTALRAAVLGPFAGLSTLLEGIFSKTFKMLDLSHWHENITSVFRAVQNEGRQALSVGISTSSFQALLGATRLAGENALNSAGEMGIGGNAEELVVFLTRLNRHVGELSFGSREAAMNFAALGIQAADLAGRGVDENFRLVAARLHDVADEGQQTALAMAIFGRGAQDILPAIRRGLDAAESEARRLGLVMSDTDNAAIRQIGVNWSTVQRAISGVWRSIAAAASPVFEVISDISVRWFSFINSLVQPVGRIVHVFTDVFKAVYDTIIDRLAPVGDAINNLFSSLTNRRRGFDPRTLIQPIVEGFEIATNAAFDFVESVVHAGGDIAENFIKPFLKGIAQLVEGFGSLVDAAGRMVMGVQRVLADALEMFGNLLRNSGILGADRLADPLFQAAADLRDGANNIAVANMNLQNVFQNAGQQVNNIADAVGLVGQNLQQWQIPRDGVAGFFQDVLNRVQNLGQQIGQQIRNGIDPALMRLGAELSERFQDPMEKFRQEFDRINAAFGAGAITQQVYNRAIEDLLSRTERELNQGPTQQAQAMLRGSAQAENVIYQAQYGSQGNNDPIARLARLQQEGNNINERVANATEAMNRLWAARQWELGLV